MSPSTPLIPPTPPTPSPSPSFSYETSPHLYLFTSLTSGSSHIITATSRLETILKANRIAFKAIDCATDERARRIWTRRAGARKLPGLVREGEILADLEQVEEWNEYGELKDRMREKGVDLDGGAGARAGAGKENAFPFGVQGGGGSGAGKVGSKEVAPDKSGEGEVGDAEEAVKSVGD